MITVINSKRPNNIIKDIKILAISGNPAKVISGPMELPNPGPTLAMAVNAPESDVMTSNPVKESNKVPIQTDIK
jgi:hypothetical protein